jgi:hypothetical protein
LQIAEHRKRRAEVDATLRRNESGGCDYPLPAVDADNPLIKRLLEIQSGLQEKKREPD